MANWIRLWFTGWNEDTFETEPNKYVDEKQKDSFDVYDPIFENARERLKLVAISLCIWAKVTNAIWERFFELRHFVILERQNSILRT